MDLSILIQIRDGLLAVMPGGRDASLIYLGVALLILASAVLRRSVSRPSALIPGLVVFVFFAVVAVVAASQAGQPPSLTRIGLDFLHLMLAPAVFVAAARWRWLRP